VPQDDFAEEHTAEAAEEVGTLLGGLRVLDDLSLRLIVAENCK